MTFEGLAHILGRLEALLAEDGGVLDRIYFCPHHPESGFPGEIRGAENSLRMPQAGDAAVATAHRRTADRSRTIDALIGDSLRDIGAARGLGIWAYGVRTGYGCRDGERYRREIGPPPVPDLMFESVSEAVDFGIGYRALAEPVVAAIRGDGEEAHRCWSACAGARGPERSSSLMRSFALDRGRRSLPACPARRLDRAGGGARLKLPRPRRATVSMRAGRGSRLARGMSVHAPGYDAATRGRR